MKLKIGYNNYDCNSFKTALFVIILLVYIDDKLTLFILSEEEILIQNK